MTSTDFHVEAIDRQCFICGSIIMKNGHHILAVLKEAPSLTFERSINLLENVTSSNISHSCWTFSGVRYSVVSAIQRCPLSRGVRYPEVSAIQRCPLSRGVRYPEVSAIQRCPLSRGVRYPEVSAIQRCPLSRGVRYPEVSAIQRCPLSRGARYPEVPVSRGARYSEVFIQGFALILAIPRKCVRYGYPLLASHLLGALYTSGVSIKLPTSVVETIYISLK